MDALISGQAGVAVLIQGNDVSLVGVEQASKEHFCSSAAVPYLFAGASDVFELKSTARNVVLTRLNSAWRSDRALQLTLISLDRSEEPQNRQLSVRCLSELLGDPDICDYVGNRLYSASLPTESDVDTALSFSQAHRPVAQFLGDLKSDQPQVERNRAAWDNLPVSLFGTERAKRDFQEAVIASGAFRLLAKASSDAAAFGLAAIECHQRLTALPNHRKIVQAWLGPLRPARATPRVQQPSDSHLNLSTESADRHRNRARPLSVHDLFENVNKQKQAIVELLKKGDVAHVRTYASQLMDSQLRTSEPQYAAMSLCDLAQEAKTVHNYSLQLELAQKAVEAAPEDGWAHGQVADAYLCLGQYDNAMRSLDFAATYGESAFAASVRARVLRAKGKLDESLTAYERAITSFPEEPNPWTGRAEVLRDMWRLDDALVAYDSAIEKFPSEIVPRCGRAAVLMDMGRLDSALEAYDQTIKEFGVDVVSFCGRAGVLKEMGKLDQALEAYTSAIATFPAEPIPRSGMAEVLKERGALDEALQAYSQASVAFPFEVGLLSGRAETFKKMRRYDEALASYEEVLQQFPDDVRAWNGKADVLKRLGRLRDSLRTYDENIRRSPYDVVAWSGRADVLKELGNLKEALVAYDFIMTRTPRKQSVRNSKAAILVVLRRYEEALKLLPEGDVQTRDEWIGQHIRGMVFLRRGRLDFAIKIFKAGVTKIPYASERKYFQNALAVANLRMRKFEQAAADLPDGREPLTNVLRMHALGGLQRIDQARESLRTLKSDCPASLISLRDELAARYKLSSVAPKHHLRWVFDEECRNVLLLAA